MSLPHLYRFDVLCMAASGITTIIAGYTLMPDTSRRWSSWRPLSWYALAVTMAVAGIVTTALAIIACFGG